jgi:hypothetical protein
MRMTNFYFTYSFLYLFENKLRFLALSYEDKCSVSMINNANFLYNFLKVFHDWNPSLLYHIYQHRKIPNYLSKNT